MSIFNFLIVFNILLASICIFEFILLLVSYNNSLISVVKKGMEKPMYLLTKLYCPFIPSLVNTI